MKSTNRLVLLFATLSITHFSCQKTDYLKINTEEIENRFLYSNRSNDLKEKAIVDFIKRQNEKHHFIINAVKKIGYPRWDKSISTNKIKKINRKNSKFDGTTYYIPFVRDSQNHVNAVMAINISSTDTSFSYLCDWQYTNKANNPWIAEDSAEHYAIFFMVMDNRVFGTNSFEITDDNLFGNGSKKAARVVINENNHNALAALLAPVEFCQDITISFVDCQYPGHPSCTPKCDECSQCMSTMSYEYCWIEYIDDGGSSGGDDNGPGLSGGLGGYIPQDCSGPAAKENQAEGCEAGWQPNNTLQSVIASQLFSILSHGDSFAFDQTLTSSNSLTFNSVSEFSNFLTATKTGETYDLNLPETIINPSQKVEKARINKTLIGGVEILINLTKSGNIWTVTDVTSSDYGITVGWEWSQKTYTQNTTPTEIVIDVFGVIKYNLFIDGIGTIYTQRQHYQLKINKQTGKITYLANKS